MNRGKAVFAQLLAQVPFSHFEHLVDVFQANKGSHPDALRAPVHQSLGRLLKETLITGEAKKLLWETRSR
jgi:hypothetical protein